jgi:hypothetical protein
MVTSPEGLGPEKDCAGKDQQHIKRQVRPLVREGAPPRPLQHSPRLSQPYRVLHTAPGSARGEHFSKGPGRLHYWQCSAIFKKYLQCVLAASILTVEFVVCALAVRKKLGQVSTCRIGPFPCQYSFRFGLSVLWPLKLSCRMCSEHWTEMKCMMSEVLKAARINFTILWNVILRCMRNRYQWFGRTCYLHVHSRSWTSRPQIPPNVLLSYFLSHYTTSQFKRP